MAETPQKPDSGEDAGPEQDGKVTPAGNDEKASDDAGEAPGAPDDDPSSGAGYGNNAGQQ